MKIDDVIFENNEEIIDSQIDIQKKKYSEITYCLSTKRLSYNNVIDKAGCRDVKGDLYKLILKKLPIWVSHDSLSEEVVNRLLARLDHYKICVDSNYSKKYYDVTIVK